MATRTTSVHIVSRLCIVVAALILLCTGTLFARSHSTSRGDWFSIETAGVAKAPVLDYARSELATFLATAGRRSKPEGSLWRFRLEVDRSLPPYAFRVTHEMRGGRHVVRLRGADASCALDAAYTWLEKMGWRFEITGPLEPAQVSWQALAAPSDETIRPAVNRRGIRQHINFPMDVSSYPLEEAKEYIHNLARMRFNQISFHSYPSQWYNGGIEGGKPMPAGHFFYGETQDVPPLPGIAAHIRNKKVFCIPEIEPIFGDEAKRATAAIEWLHAVIKEAKRAGMIVQFSFEPRSTETSVESTVALSKHILETYPEIDCLELMTMEGAGDARMNEKEMREMLVRHYGERFLNDPFITAPMHGMPYGLGAAIGQTGHNIKAARALRGQPWARKDLRLSIGVYITNPPHLAVLCRLIREAAPELEVAVLPQYGSRRTADALTKLDLRPQDFGALTVYSWLELDGLMYFQQNSVHGIHTAVAWLQSGAKDKPVTALLFNHWRTAENRAAARYAALSTLYGAQDEGSFYTAYAADLGLGAPETFRDAMLRLDETDGYSRGHLKNSGFCWSGWWNGGFRLEVDAQNFREARKGYREAKDLLQCCAKATTTPRGQEWLAFLDNSLRCTILLCNAFESQSDLKPATSKEDAAKICNRTMILFEQYEALYVEQLPDRGSEGTVVSFYNGPMKGLLRTRQSAAGIPFDAPFTTSQSGDAPPVPIRKEQDCVVHWRGQKRQGGLVGWPGAQNAGTDSAGTSGVLTAGSSSSSSVRGQFLRLPRNWCVCSSTKMDHSWG